MFRDINIYDKSYVSGTELFIGSMSFFIITWLMVTLLVATFIFLIIDVNWQRTITD